MTIQRVESLSYGVDDMAASTRYLEDLGLEKLDGGKGGATFRTLENQIVHLRDAADAALPSVPESGPTMREVVWGVDTHEALDAIAAELATDRDVETGADGILHTRDESGFAIAFGLADRRPVEVAAPDFNVNGTVHRINRPVARDRKPRPIRIGHVVYQIEKQGCELATAFYRDRLAFRCTDSVNSLGEFLRCEGALDHHSLFLLWVRDNGTRFDHAAYELADFDDVFVGGQRMKADGWRSHDGPGRQGHGSHIYWHFENPAGGTTEYFTDMDRFDDSWEPRILETPAGRGLWKLDTA